MNKAKLIILVVLPLLARFNICLISPAIAQKPPEFAVIGYYAGNATGVSNIRPKLLTHLIYGFCNLRGNKLYLADTLTIRKLVALKKQNPKLKVMLALGGWGGCRTCSDIFTSEVNREAFAISVLQACKKLGTDGIDLDWEYPAVKGFPGHTFKPEDKFNFTKLVQQLRAKLGKNYEISFAAGAYTEYLERSIDWIAVMKEVDRVNLMTYDLVNGWSPITGHHASLYNTRIQKESADNAVNYLIKLGILPSKLVIGAAFYARVWQEAENVNNGLYQSAKPKATLSIGTIEAAYNTKNGYATFWDDDAKAPYRYNPQKKIFVTYDNERSVRLKTRYALENKLGGIMFWQIRLDNKRKSLLDEIHAVLENQYLDR